MLLFHPQGSNIYRPGIRVKFYKDNYSRPLLAEPSTFRIVFDLPNTDNAAKLRLRPIGGPWSFFSRMRILAGGQILEDIDLYNRVREMFNMFSATDNRQNDYAEGFLKFMGYLNGQHTC